MAKINILSDEICNRIAAGEVIDRPYSAVKEMIENSLDAGATEISVYIERGGKDLIKIVDNGCGIEKDDMRSAFLAHATSKISCIDDIDKITTLGFRGEALATIAAISKVELISVTAGHEANKVVCDGDKIGPVEPAVLEVGTQITVRNLFFNTPARAKFMKTDKKEEADITNFVSRYILGNPNVAFKYYVNGKLNLQSYGGGLDEAIVQVYGANYLSQCIKINAEKNDVKIHGYIGNQNFFKPNKTYQSMFLNGRYVTNPTIQTAISNAYLPYAMKRQYPTYTLFIDVPLDFVDVNVHPNKADVRFVNNNLIFGSVYKVVSSVLDGTTKAADFVVENTVAPQVKSTSDNESQPDKQEKPDNKQDKPDKEVKTAYKYISFEDKIIYKQVEYDRLNSLNAKPLFDIDDYTDCDMTHPYGSCVSNQPRLGKTYDKNNRPDYLNDDYFAGTYFGDDDQPKKSFAEMYGPEMVAEQEEQNKLVKDIEQYAEIAEIGDANKLQLYQFFDNTPYNKVPKLRVCSGDNDYLTMMDLPSEEEIQAKKQAEQQKIEYNNCKYKGNLFNTYLLYELRDDIYIIDQHAAHERLLYDKFREQMKTRKIARQGMLVPFMLDLNVNESAFISDNLSIIRGMGFDIEPFGSNSFRINEVPVDLQDIDLRKFFDELLSDLNGLKSIKLEDMLKDKIATTACKHAVKGGMELTEEERQKLFDMLEGDMGLKCPHGRPICVKLTKQQIEKMFKRIV